MTSKSCILLIALLGILVSANFFGQGITWQKTYQGPFINSWDIGYDICSDNTGNFYFVGYTNLPNHAYILKLNPYGDTIWSKLSLRNSIAFTCTMSNNGGVVFAELSDSVYIVELDSSGNKVWERSYVPLAGDVKLYDIISSVDGGYLACGEGLISNVVGYVIKIDSQGELEWQNVYQSTNFLYFKSATVALDGGFLLTGGVRNSPTDTPKCLIYKIDSNGNLLWNKSYGLRKGAAGTAIVKSAQSYFVYGTTLDTAGELRQVFLMKTDSNGDTLFSKIYYANVFELSFDIKRINPNRYVMSLARDSAMGEIRSGKAIISDSLGNIVKTKLFQAVRYLDMYSILPLSNGDIIFAGTYDYYTYWAEHRYDFYAVRTDSALNFPPLPPIGIVKNENGQPQTFRLHQNIPNPFNPITQIKFELPKNAYVWIKVYNTLGELVETLLNNEYKTAGVYSVAFDGTNFASGIYFYTLETTEYRESKKMVLIR